MKNMLLLTTAMALTACAETVYNASPSIFPPITGTQVLPTRAQGYYQGRPDEFIRQLSDADQVSLGWANWRTTHRGCTLPPGRWHRCLSSSGRTDLSGARHQVGVLRPCGLHI